MISRPKAWLALLLTVGFAPFAGAQEVLATVDGTEITDLEFRYFVEEVARAEIDETTLASDRESILEYMAALHHLAEEGRKRGLDDDPKVRQRVEEAFRKEAASMYRRRYLEEKARETIRESALIDYYQDHYDDYNQPERVSFRHIFFNIVDIEQGESTPEEIDKAVEVKKLRIAAAQEELLKGIDFVTVAKAYSDSAQGERGALVTAVRIDDRLHVAGRPLLRSFQKELDKLAQGQTGQPFLTKNGYEIFRLERRTPAVRLPYGSKRVQEEILDRLVQEKCDRLEQTALADVRVVRNYQILERSDRDRESVVAAVGEEDLEDCVLFSVGDYEKMLAGMTPTAREEMLGRNQRRIDSIEERVILPAQYWILVRRMGLDASPEMQAARRRQEEVILAAEVLRPMIKARLEALPISEIEMMDYWRDPRNFEQFSTNVSARFSAFAVPAGDETNMDASARHASRQLSRKTAEEIIQKIQEGWEFDAVVAFCEALDRSVEQEEGDRRHLGRRLAVDIPDTGWITALDLQHAGVRSSSNLGTMLGLSPGECNPRPIPYRQNMTALLPGRHGNLVFIGRETEAPALRPFQEVREAVREAMENDRRKEIEKQIHREALAKVRYRIHEEVWNRFWRD